MIQNFSLRSKITKKQGGSATEAVELKAATCPVVWQPNPINQGNRKNAYIHEFLIVRRYSDLAE